MFINLTLVDFPQANSQIPRAGDQPRISNEQNQKINKKEEKIKIVIYIYIYNSN
jgi:hypothetical protein